ncbi:glycoside hydrolase family 25 protein [Botryobacter ruber]|uniref:glycoside hydrolase family 25 protein n=1 Tax=Botryobacter ruber TaxID=2171629 RepID=UPI000E0B4BEE|nr:GH25 family lysozyme [Botryobacter ruber]
MFSAFYFLSCQKLISASLLLLVNFASVLNDSTDAAVTNDPTPIAAAAPKAATLRGIDVSRWQLHVDWQQVKEAEITFAFVKATQGDVRQDPFFFRNWEETKRVGIKRGAYHYFLADAPPLEQAALFKSTVWLEAGDLPPVLDVEASVPGMDAAEFRQNVRTWLETIENHYGFRPIIYTNQSFYRRWLKGHFNEYFFWIARYSSAEPQIHESDKWLFWQFSDRGRIPGIKADVDLNTFTGDWETLHALCLPELPHTDNTPLFRFKSMLPLP